MRNNLKRGRLVDYIKTILISATPIFEQRGAIPAGILIYNLNPFVVFLISYIGSLLPAPIILLFFNIIFDWMKRFKFFNLINRYIERKLDKGSKKIDRYKNIGLLIFVAIPLPTTGVWTGSAVASFLGLDLKKSFMYIAAGAFISAIAITILSIVFPAFLGY